MRWRLLGNAAVAAAAASVHVIFLYAFLNPSVGSGGSNLVRLVGGLCPVYTLTLSLPVAAAYLLYGYFGSRPLPRRWVEWRYWGSFFVLLNIWVVVAYGLNARFYRHLLDPAALNRLIGAALAILTASLAVAITVFSRRLAQRSAARMSALGIVVTVWLILAGLLSVDVPEASPPYRTELEPLASARPLTIIGIDGLSPELLLPLISEGRLPAFARLMREGSYGALRAFPPGDGVTLWTTILTGKQPHRHGVRGMLRYRLLGGEAEITLPPHGVGFGFLRTLGLVLPAPITAEHRRVRAFWDILSAFRIPSAFLGFPLAPPVSSLPSIQFRAAMDPPTSPAPADLEEWWPRLVEENSQPMALQDEVLKRGLAADMLLLEESERLRSGKPSPRVRVVRLSGFDYVLHRFLRYHQPSKFGNVPDTALERYGHTISEYCKFLDVKIAREIEAVGNRGMLLVVSSHGMTAESITARAIRNLRGAASLSGTHHRGPSGILFMYGPGVQAGSTLNRARLTDVLPTLLYLLGLPVARDLDGEPMTEAMTVRHLEATPASSIPNYEGVFIGEQIIDTFPEPGEEFPVLD
ncbi:MAG: alkaline phosphatase family protein [Acidobacteriota bacterium]